MVVRTLAFVIVRRILGLVGLGSAPDAKDIEIAVLRHQLMVVRRQVADRATHPPTGWCWRYWRGCCHGNAGRSSLLHPPRCCGGIGSWWPAAGPTRPSGQVGRPGPRGRRPGGADG